MSQQSTPENDPNATADTAQQQPEAADATQELDPLEQLKAELEQLQAERLLERADLENQRKRLARDIEMTRKFANEKLLADLLPVFDSIDAGLASASADNPLHAGLELTRKQLLDMAAKNGMREIAPQQGDAFSPEHHNAVSQVASETVASGAIVQVFQKGYVLNERLLRPAMVVVAA